MDGFKETINKADKFGTWDSVSLKEMIAALEDAEDIIKAKEARIAELEAENATLKQEVKEYWCETFERESIQKDDGWYIPYMSGGEYAAEALLANGIVERDPTDDVRYRYVEKGGG